MKFIHNPNQWSCLLCCTAMITGHSIEDLTKLLGHDGSEKVEDGWRGFTVDEIMFVFLTYDIQAYCFNKKTLGYYSKNRKFRWLDFQFWDKLLEAPVKICMNEKHAWIDNNGVMYDPALDSPRVGYRNNNIGGLIIIGRNPWTADSQEVHQTVPIPRR